MEEYMESELYGIFRVKLVTKNIERGFPGTQFMYMRVNRLFVYNIIPLLFRVIDKTDNRNHGPWLTPPSFWFFSLTLLLRPAMHKTEM